MLSLLVRATSFVLHTRSQSNYLNNEMLYPKLNGTPLAKVYCFQFLIKFAAK